MEKSEKYQISRRKCLAAMDEALTCLDSLGREEFGGQEPEWFYEMMRAITSLDEAHDTALYEKSN